jgi:hypothetical protein
MDEGMRINKQLYADLIRSTLNNSREIYDKQYQSGLKMKEKKNKIEQEYNNRMAALRGETPSTENDNNVAQIQKEYGEIIHKLEDQEKQANESAEKEQGDVFSSFQMGATGALQVNERQTLNNEQRQTEQEEAEKQQQHDENFEMRRSVLRQRGRRLRDELPSDIIRPKAVTPELQVLIKEKEKREEALGGQIPTIYAQNIVGNCSVQQSITSTENNLNTIRANNNDKAICCICFAEYEDNDGLYWYHFDPKSESCYHTAHFECAYEWCGLPSNNYTTKCPLCNKTEVFSNLTFKYKEKQSGGGNPKTKKRYQKRKCSRKRKAKKNQMAIWKKSKTSCEKH